MNSDPTIIIIAGPNGVGKTTFAKELAKGPALGKDPGD
jgi:adenylate kinase family enzyme